MVKHEVFDGVKATRLEDLPPEAWRVIQGEFGRSEAAKMWKAVAWLRRCIDIRAVALATMPFEVKRGDTVIWSDEDVEMPDDLPWLAKLPILLWQTEASTLMEGEAYWLKQDMRWLVPNSITPKFRESDGRLTHFERRRSGEEAQIFQPREIGHFWPPDPFVEIGPARDTVVGAAISASKTLKSLDDFLEKHFDRGMVKLTLLTYKSPISSDQAATIKEWWQRVAQGVKNAWNTMVIRGDFDPKVVGEGVGDLKDTALTATEREAICAAMGVPQSKVTANAANFATKQSDDAMFITDTMIFEAMWIESVLNEQIFEPAGLSWKFRPQKLTVMQADEHERSQSVLNYVNAGMTLEAAVAVLGVDVPDDVQLEEPKPEPPPMMPGQPPPPNPEAEEERATLRRWIGNRQKDGRRIDLEQFEAKHLQPWEKAMVALELGVEAADGEDNPFLSYP